MGIGSKDKAAAVTSKPSLSEDAEAQHFVKWWSHVTGGSGSGPQFNAETKEKFLEHFNPTSIGQTIAAQNKAIKQHGPKPEIFENAAMFKKASQRAADIMGEAAVGSMLSVKNESRGFDSNKTTESPGDRKMPPTPNVGSVSSVDVVPIFFLDPSLYDFNTEIVWNGTKHTWEWKYRPSEEASFDSYINFRLALEDGSAVNVETDVHVTVSRSYILEVKIKRSVSMQKPSEFYEAEEEDYLEKVRLAANKEDARNCHKEFQRVSARAEAELAEVSSLKNHYQDSYEWMVWRHQLEKEVELVPDDFFIQQSGNGNTLIVQLKIVESDKYVAKKKARIEQKKG